MSILFIVVQCHALPYSFVSTYYDRAKDYFAIDPLLLKLFAYLAPKAEFSALCEHMPPYLSIEILVNRALLPIHPNVSCIINKMEAVSESSRSFPGRDVD